MATVNPTRFGKLLIVFATIITSIAARTLLFGQMPGAQSRPASVSRTNLKDTTGIPTTSTFAVAPVPKDPARASSVAPPSAVSAPPRVVSTVYVNANPEDLSAGIDLAHHITQDNVLSSAGNFGDFTRYLQTLPAVVWSNDLTNDLMIRGGHPTENLFVVDGFEVPNINHLAFAGTTGGFTSMIDTSVVDSVDMKDDSYNSRYSSRMSALIDIHTLPEAPEGRAHADFGISGIGGFVTRKLPRRVNILLAAHRSVLNWFTDNIGIDGVPIYTNGFARGDWKTPAGNRVSFLTLAGSDSLSIKPCAWNELETLINDTSYDGTRVIQGVQWQQLHSPRSSSILTASYSLQSRLVAQDQQNPGVANVNRRIGADLCKPLYLIDVYRENARDGLGVLRYELDFTKHSWNFSMGSGMELAENDYTVAQPKGQQSPFSTNPSWTDSDSFARSTNTSRTGTFLEASYRTDAGWTFLGGVRYETSALTGSQTVNPRASVAFKINSHQALSVSANHTSQEPQTIDMLSYPQNRRLSTIAVTQISTAMEVWRSGWLTAQVQAFQKRYSNEPISTEYPSLMSANMVDLLGQQIVWLPLRSGGYGKSEGVSTLIRVRWHPWLQLIASSNYGHVRYAAADGILRPGNFDLRFVGNGLLASQFSRHFSFFARDTYASGRPYTPFDLVDSYKQARGIYDLNRINAFRAPPYNRLDLELTYSVTVRHKGITVHSGVENAFDRSNFLGYFWLPRMPKGGTDPAFTMEKQLVRFPIIRATYDF